MTPPPFLIFIKKQEKWPGLGSLRWACQYWVLKTLILIELVADIYWQKIGGATNELALNGCRMSHIICRLFSVLKNAGSASG